MHISRPRRRRCKRNPIFGVDVDGTISLLCVCITRVARCIVCRAPFLLQTIARGSRFHAAPKNVFFANGPPPQKTLAAAPTRGHAHRDEAAGGGRTAGRLARRRTRRTRGRSERARVHARILAVSLHRQRTAATRQPGARSNSLPTARGGGAFRLRVAPAPVPLPRSDITSGGGGWQAGCNGGLWEGANISFP